MTEERAAISCRNINILCGKFSDRGIRGGRVLDIGTGTGRLAIELAREKNCHFELVALDISDDMLRVAVDNANRYGVADKITFVKGTAASLPFPDKSFDLIISYASLHHWFKPISVFNEMVRVINDSGSILVRDNKRVYDVFAWRVFIWFISRFMNKRHRENWPKALMASYKISEVKKLVGQTKMKNCRVYSDFARIDVCVESSSK